MAYPLDESELPLLLPEVESYRPGPEGEGPLANIPEWVAKELETNTMPGYAGSSWYFLRYMDPHNNETFCDRKVSDYWNQVDLYIGGTEHAVGHLLYSRMWTKVLYDLGYIGFDEPFKKLLNQGMITGISQLIHRFGTSSELESSFSLSNNLPYPIIPISNDESFIYYYSADYLEEIPNGKFHQIRVPIECVDNSVLDIQKLVNQKKDYSEAVFVCKEGYYLRGKWYRLNSNREEIKPLEFKTISLVEKMSKSKLNTVSPFDPENPSNPDTIVVKYGADTFRMYEMFLGPVDQSKPWDTKGIEGVHRFLKKLWRLFFDELKGKVWNEEKATPGELKVLHRTIRKIEDDTERFSFNTAVSTLMICVNELADLKCHKREVLESLLIMLAPYAPHIAAELWKQLGHEDTILDAHYPVFHAAHVTESSKEYPVSINGRVRTNLNLSLDATAEQVQELVLANELVQKWMEGKPLKKLIFVKGKMINIVV
ncbi:MAG: hypothetical protein NVSMB63_10300 [Sediminibacterium sp.]